MSTLFTAILELSKILQNTLEGTATGGSTTTLLDSQRGEASDYFDKGTIWFLSGGNANKSTEILDWIPTTFTFATQTSSLAAGVRYAAASGEYPRWLLIQSINQALMEMRPLQQNTSLTTVAYQEEYTLPSGVYNVKRVEVGYETTDPYNYAPNYHWREQGGKIVFDSDLAPIYSGYKLRITYHPEHTNLTADTDTINDLVPVAPMIWKATAIALRWKLRLLGGDFPDKRNQLNEAIVIAEQKAGAWKVPSSNRDPHLARW